MCLDFPVMMEQMVDRENLVHLELLDGMDVMVQTVHQESLECPVRPVYPVSPVLPVFLDLKENPLLVMLEHLVKRVMRECRECLVYPDLQEEMVSRVKKEIEVTSDPRDLVALLVNLVWLEIQVLAVLDQKEIPEMLGLEDPQDRPDQGNSQVQDRLLDPAAHRERKVQRVIQENQDQEDMQVMLDHQDNPDFQG